MKALLGKGAIQVKEPYSYSSRRQGARLLYEVLIFFKSQSLHGMINTNAPKTGPGKSAVQLPSADTKLATLS